VRYRFPTFERLVYVNTCAQGALSDSVREATECYLRDWEDRGSPWDYWGERADAARAAFARLVNASPDEVALTTSVSAGVSSLASSLRYRAARSKIVLTNFEFPTIGQIWHAQECRGAHVVHVPPHPDGTIPLESFARAIDSETLLVSITHVSYTTGTMLDVERIAELAHSRGAFVLLDAYQSVGSVPIDVKKLDVDFLAAGTLKYLLGSSGLAFLYCRSELISETWPTATGWLADQDVAEMDIYDYSPATTARRFEAGTPPMPAVYAGLAGMELMEGVGITETRDHVLALQCSLLEGLNELGATTVTPRDPMQHGPLVCVACTDAGSLVKALAAEHIVASSRMSNLRLSLHCYNSRDDVQAILAALAVHRSLLT
jgi:selenocysteine lyase/cysteine desulfurase